MSANESRGRFDDETLLQWLLDAELRSGVPRSDVESARPQELAELETFIADCRSALLVEDPRLAEDARRVAESVLSRTVREDLGWRGDLRLVRGFMANRMRSSLLLRFAAASLLVHLIALPVIAAYRIWKAEEQKHTILISLEGIPEQPFGEVPTEVLEPGRSADLPALDSLDALSFETINARNADRWSIFERGEELRAVAEGDWANELEARLAARARRLIGAEPFTVDTDASSDALDRLLALDEALDARLFGLPIPLDADELEWLMQAAAGEPPHAAVALAVLRRAQRYGVTLPTDSAILIARLSTPAFAAFAGLLEPAGEAPLSAAWVRALSASDASGAVSPSFMDALRR
jgi:hypothetical protein